VKKRNPWRAWGLAAGRSNETVLTQFDAKNLGGKAGTVIRFEGPPCKVANDRECTFTVAEIAALEKQYGAPIQTRKSRRWGR
jgi:hypothetical protein